MQTLAGFTNDALLLRHARPGTLGMLTSWSPEQTLSGLGERSLWSACFAVVERRVREGWEEIVIAESTWIPPEHRMDADLSPSGLSDGAVWMGPQRSVVLARRIGDGRLRGHDERRSLRRYRDPVHTPNLALFDLGLEAAALDALRLRVRSSLEPSAGAGAVCEQGGASYVCALLDGLTPTFEAPAAPTPDAIYHQLRGLVPGWQVLRNPRLRSATARITSREGAALHA